MGLIFGYFIAKIVTTVTIFVTLWTAIATPVTSFNHINFGNDPDS